MKMNVFACDFFFFLVPVGDLAFLGFVLQKGFSWWWWRTGMQQVGSLEVICVKINAVTGLCSDKLAHINKHVYKDVSDLPHASAVPCWSHSSHFSSWHLPDPPTPTPVLLPLDSCVRIYFF